MTEVLDFIKSYGGILGTVSTAIALFALFKNHVSSRASTYIVKESGRAESEKADEEIKAQLNALSEKFATFAMNTAAFQERMERHIHSQNDVNQKVMADIIETAYHAHKDTQTIDSNTWKHVTEVYAVYHSPEVHGNSYISSIFSKMENWEIVG